MTEMDKEGGVCVCTYMCVCIYTSFASIVDMLRRAGSPRELARLEFKTLIKVLSDVSWVHRGTRHMQQIPTGVGVGIDGFLIPHVAELAH